MGARERWMCGRQPSIPRHFSHHLARNRRRGLTRHSGSSALVRVSASRDEEGEMKKPINPAKSLQVSIGDLALRRKCDLTDITTNVNPLPTASTMP